MIRIPQSQFQFEFLYQKCDRSAYVDIMITLYFNGAETIKFLQ